MNQDNLKKILASHAAWLLDEGGEKADLSGADLSDADLRYANLSDADLRYANLSGADLSDADLRYANLSGANLSGADLSDADLRYANLSGADLSDADLIGANLRDANLSDANLRSADLTGAWLPHFSVCPEIGAFVAFKSVKCKEGKKAVITLEIPATAKRVNAIGSRKCRASEVTVIDAPPGVWFSPTNSTKITYTKGATLSVPDFCEDVRIECAPGIHFFMTRKEAEEW